MGQAVIVFSFPEPEDRLEFGHILEQARKIFIERSDIKVHAARAEAAEKIMSFLETGISPEGDSENKSEKTK